MRACSTFVLVLVASVLTLALAGVVAPGSPWYAEGVLAIASAIAGAITIGTRFLFHQFQRRRHGEEDDDQKEHEHAREGRDVEEREGAEDRDDARGARAGEDGGDDDDARRRDERARRIAALRLIGGDVLEEDLFETRVRNALKLAREEFQRDRGDV